MTNKELYEGKRLKSKSYGWYTIKEYNNFDNVVIEFDSGFKKTCNLKEVKSGAVKDPTFPSIYGVGYIGEGEFTARVKGGKNTPCYDSWRGLLRRCYSSEKRFKARYSECTVDSKWYNFQNFAEWYYNNLKYDGRVEVDKDLLIKGNKLYSEDTCALVPTPINSLLSGASKENRGKYPLGVYFNKSHKKYRAQLHRNGESQDCLGYFNTPEEAFICYKYHKEIHIKEVANKYKECISNDLYNRLMEYEVNIDD